MKSNHPYAKRPAQVAVALGAILLISGCTTPDPMFAERPAKLDGGVGQLLQYCSKFHQSGDLVTAAGLCERAHRLEPTNPAPLMQLADILIAMEQPQQAEAAYNTIIDADPGQVDARYALGKLYIGMERYDLAAAQFQTAINRAPADVRLYNALGIAQGLQGADDAALQSFEAGLKVAPKDVSLRNNYGLSLVLNGRTEEGIKVLEAVAADPKSDETSYQNLQLAYGMVTAANDEPSAESAARQSAAWQPQAIPENAEPMAERPMPEPMQRARPDATPGTPVTLIEAPEPMQPQATEGEPERPLTVTIMDQRPAYAASPSTPEAPERNAVVRPERRSPLFMQTARANTGETQDTDGPSATMGGYLEANATHGETGTDTSEPRTGLTPAGGTEPEVASLPPETPGTAERAPGGDYMVQLASYLSAGKAQSGWDELRAAAPDLLEDVEHVVHKADLGAEKGTFYRLRTAPLAKSDADALCSALKARDIDCLVVKDQAADGSALAG